MKCNVYAKVYKMKNIKKDSSNSLFIYLFISNADKELRPYNCTPCNLLQNTAGEHMPPKPPGLTSTIAGRKPARPLRVATIFSLSKFEFCSDL